MGAFKVRGGINLISQLSPEERTRGVIAASTGNHGQSVAYAARLFDVKAIIVVPEKANPGKVAAMQGMGAEVIFHGATYDESKLHCEALAHIHGYRYIHSGNEPLLIAGVATEGLEMLEDEPGLDVIVPIGGGRCVHRSPCRQSRYPGHRRAIGSVTCGLRNMARAAPGQCSQSHFCRGTGHGRGF